MVHYFSGKVMFPQISLHCIKDGRDLAILQNDDVGGCITRPSRPDSSSRLRKGTPAAVDGCWRTTTMPSTRNPS
jgi:hypothetical protein